MKKVFCLILAVIFSNSLIAQTQKVKGSLAYKDTADLTILNIYPDSFPNVSVVFKAQTKRGEPIWNLTKDKMNVNENQQNCEVVSLEQISKNKPVNIGIVVDHSGSMMLDQKQLFDENGQPLFSFDLNNEPILPEGYTSPIENAKSAIKSFVGTFNVKKDFISVVGFSNVVDKVLPLTNDISKVSSVVDSMNADFSTALYDAMLEGLDKIKTANGVKVLVVLTDGQDNSSKSNWNDVITKASQLEIPIYIIGLGDVNQDTLQQITKATNGQFYYTQSSTSLISVYSVISKQVQAFYNLVYSSPNFSSLDSTRQLEISFDVDSIYLNTQPANFKLPKEVVLFLKDKEVEKNYLIGGGMVLAVVISSGIIFYKRKKKLTNS